MLTTEEAALQIRQHIVKMLVTAGSGHIAGALDTADLLAVLYFSDLARIDPSFPSDPSRDRIILSAGHTCPGLYAALALRGFFPVEELDTLRVFGSRLQGHPHLGSLPGIEFTGGSLGQGASFAVGVAIGVKKLWEQGRLDHLPKVYCLMGDGELEEGQCWEAFMAASKFKLNHLTFIIDRNGIQIDGFTENVMPLEPLKNKLESFGLLTFDIDGHSHEVIKNTLKFDAAFQSKPTAIILHTIPGKGVGYMEGKPLWHGKSPNLGEAIEALKELKEKC